MSTPSILQSIKVFKQNEKKKKKLEESKKGEEKEGNQYMCSLWHRIFFRSEQYYVKGPESDKFNRKTFEIPIENLDHVNEQNLGFSNQVLIQDNEKQIQIYVPTFVSLKVKSIQELNIKDLVAKIQCVLIIVLYVQSLPEEILTHLRSKIMVQVNRGEGFFLIEEDGKTNIKFKEAGKNKEFFMFTIRQNFPVQIYEDIFWSPFEVLRLVFSVTINSVSISKPKKEKKQESPVKPQKIQKLDTSKIEYNPAKSYSISFNSMRNPEKININYITGCRVGVYDLAENLLEGYPSNLATYDEIRDNFTNFVEGGQKKSNEDDKIIIQRENDLQDNIKANKKRGKILEPRPEEIKKKDQKKGAKIKYYQYCHFVIPLYKYPGNAMATIFIPIFMLSLLSLSIFFQSKNIDDKIGSIATFVLGFIALIPSIKDELPPSQKITFSQIIVYTQALNCMLSLVSHWFTDSENVWLNPIFILSLIIHICCFSLAIALFYLHVFWWQPLYNRSNKVKEVDSVSNRHRWDNPYCDQVFLEFNSKLKGQKRSLAVFSAHSSGELKGKEENIQKKEKDGSKEKKEEGKEKKEEQAKHSFKKEKKETEEWPQAVEVTKETNKKDAAQVNQGSTIKTESQESTIISTDLQGSITNLM